MDKRVILAVAGAGKTTEIVNLLTEDARAAVITYTENNYENLRRAILDKFGYMPPKIRLYTYFEFLHSFCFRPLLLDELKTKGLTFERPSWHTFNLPMTTVRRYIDSSRFLYANRLAKLLEVKGVIPDCIRRLEKYFDWLFVDEVQDFGGHDFNFLMDISKAEVNHVYVGDFYQHTFETSSDGNVNKGLYNELDRYIERLGVAGLDVDRESLKQSYRCSPTVCSFVSETLGIEMESARTDATNIIWINSEEEAQQIYECDNIIKLFYDKHYTYGCRSNNWGRSKGDTYHGVCVVLNKTTLDKMQSGEVADLKPSTRNKLYVACTRAMNTLYFVSEQLIKSIAKRSGKVV